MLHDILVCIDGTAAADVRFQLALNLVQTSKAHLTAVYALREPAAWLSHQREWAFLLLF